MGGCNRRVARLLLTCAFLAIGAAAQAQGNGESDPLAAAAPSPASYDQLTLELALMQKTKADELFIGGDREGAEKGYGAAKTLLSGGELELGDAEQTQKQLLQADIDYRLLLLRRGFGFWGALQSLRPSVPVTHLRRMEELLRKYRALNQEIEAAAQRAGDDGIKALELQALVVARESDLRQAAVQSESITMREDFVAQQQDRLDGRIDNLKAQRNMLESQLAAAISEARAASSALNGLIVNAAAASMGIPPEVASAVQSRQWDRAVIAIAGSELANTPAFKAALADIDQSVLEVAEKIREGEELIRTGQQTLETVNAVRNALRDPTLQGLASLGAQLYERLPAETKQQWARTIRDEFPAGGLVEMIDIAGNIETAKSLRDATIGYLAGDLERVRDAFRREIANQIQTKLDTLPDFDLAKYHADLIAEAGRLATRGNDQKAVLDQMVRSWPTQFLALLPAPASAEIMRIAGVQNREDLIQRLRQRGLRDLGASVRFEDGTLSVRAGGNVLASVAYPQLIDFTQTATPEAVAAEAKTRLLDAVDALESTGSEALRRVLLSRLPNDFLELAVSSIVTSGSQPEERRRRAWNEITGAMPIQHQQAALASIVQTHIGSVVAADHAKTVERSARDEARRYQSPDAEDSGPSTQDAMTEAAAKMALNAVFPGASVAVDAFKSFNNFNDSIKRAQRLASQLQQNIADELQVLDLIGEARLKREVLLSELAIARLSQASALQQYDLFATAVQGIASDRADNKNKVMARRSLAFYINERMRNEFDALDRSVMMWTGRGSIESRVRDNPQNIRLALDQDIHLYQWFDRSREGRRADIDGLVVHWEKLVEIAKNDCQLLGCDDGEGELGKVKQSELIRLTDLLTEVDLQRLKKWQRERGRAILELPLRIRPDGELSRFAIGSDMENVRLIELRLGRRTNTGLVPLTAIKLGHAGPGYIRRGGAMVRETLLPQQFTSFDAPEPFRVEDLRRRFLIDRPNLKQFEGYPLYSTWVLSLLPNPENWSAANDALLRFALHYTSTATDSLESDFLRRAEIPPPAEGLSNAAFRYTASWSNGSRREAQVTLDGTTRRVALPPRGETEVAAEHVAALFAPEEELNPTIGNTPPAAGRPAALTVTRKCLPDSDLRRFLYQQIQRDSAPGMVGAEIRQKVEAEMRGPKQEACAPRVIQIRGSH